MSFVITPPPVPAVPVVGGGSFPVHRIYCVGRNYVEHAKEMGFTGREPPFFFMKPADAAWVAGADGAVTMRYPSLTKSLHHEIELVVAIGTGGRDILAADAMKHVWGYGVGIDMTRRDLQGEAKKLGRPWDIGKGFEESAPISALVPAAKTQVGPDTRIWLDVNGKRRQESTIGKLIWSIPEIIEHLSTAWTLAPGDLIFTGTPEGVNAVEAGDVITCGVDGVGQLKVDVAGA
jgi:fumarylpyruvate hydrolase